MKPKNFLSALSIISENHSNELIINYVKSGGVVNVGESNPTIHLISCTASTVDKLKEANFSLSMEDGKMSINDYCIE